MRKTFTFLLILIIKFGFGQNVFNFIDSNATWNVSKTFAAGTPQSPGFAATTTKIYGFRGDTLMSSQLWAKMYYTADSNFTSSIDFKKAGYLRSAGTYVLFMDTILNLDTLYDFNLQIGDSVKYNFNFDTTYIYVSTIDSLIVDGKYHKRFFFTEPSGPNVFTYLHEIWIEGIGSKHGPLFPQSPTVFSQEEPDKLDLTCYQNGPVIWHNSSYNDCYNNIILSAEEYQKPEGNMLVFSNPAKAELEVKFSESTNEDFLISIFDLNGNQVVKKSVKRNKEIAIDIDSLKSNFYILQVESGKQVYRTKFVKE